MIWPFAGQSSEVTRGVSGSEGASVNLGWGAGLGLGREEDGTSREHGSHPGQACDR